MILLTGATGCLGRELLGRLLMTRPQARIGLLVRGGADGGPEVRVSTLLDEVFGTGGAERFLPRLRVIASDVTQDDFGLGRAEFEALSGELTAIYHCAATTSLTDDLQTARRVNVGGTYQVLKLAEKAVRRGDADFRLHHISTAYVAGTREGTVGPDELDLRGGFRNGYEQSKAEAETMVRALRETIPSCIYRPSIIVGDSVTGQTSAFNVIYIPARFAVKGFFRWFPAIPHTPFDVVPVDYVADAILALSGRADIPAGSAFHLAAGIGRESTPFEILEHLIETFNKYCRRRRGLLAVPPLVPPEILSRAHSSIHAARSSMRVMERMVTQRLNIFRQTLPFIPYMTSNPQFDTGSTIHALDGVLLPPPLFRTYAERLFRYCLDTNWGREPWTNPGNFLTWHHRLTLSSEPG